MVGLGLVGSALAVRFLEAGYGVVGFDVDAARRDELRALGGTVAGSAVEVARAARRIVLSLPNSEIVRGVVESMRPALASGTIVVDTTTGDPEPTAALGESLAVDGIAYLDATIAGSSAQVRAGEVLVIAGGEAEAFAACRDLFATFARQAFHVGPWGSGARMKLLLLPGSSPSW